MTMHLEPTSDVPIPQPNEPSTPKLNILEMTQAAANTAQLLGEHGIDLEPTKADKDTAAAIVTEAASDPDKADKRVVPKKAATMTPASLILTSTILKNYAHAVVENSKQLRHLVTNKLIVETENPDPRVRIRALELLGKISDVGLFADKTEITVTHQTTDDIKERLRSKLTKLINPTGHDNYDNSAETIEDAEIIEAEREVDAAFGIATKREVDAALGQNEEGYDD
jgi:hypothetical protein